MSPPRDLDVQLADQRGKNNEREFIRAARARRVSWAHLARQLGKSEADLRARYGRLDRAGA